MIPFSVLDLCPIASGSDAAQALRNTLDLAQHAELWGYKRFWLAEHHNIPGIASAATSVVIGHVAAGTRSIRVGSGGIMLPNHAPLVIAEQFGTLATLFPNRIDLGLGRAPGADPLTARALRREGHNPQRFGQDVAELQGYFGPAQPGQMVRAVPGAGLEVPLYLLGSSLFSAELAARMGLPFAFASHFAPDLLAPALEIYRSLFEPSDVLQKPYVLLGVNVFAAPSDEEARLLFTSQQQAFVLLRRGQLGLLPPPVDSIEDFWSPPEQEMVERALACSMVGSPQTVRRELEAFVLSNQPNELLLTAQIHDHAARLRSFEIAAQVRGEMDANTAPAPLLTEVPTKSLRQR